MLVKFGYGRCGFKGYLGNAGQNHCIMRAFSDHYSKDSQLASPHVSARRPVRILLPEGSSTSARQLLYCLRPDDVVDILDPNPLCQCRFALRCRRWYRCPRFACDPLGYLRFLVERLKAEKYDVLLPSHEQAYLLSRVGQRLGELVGLALPKFEALQRMQDKAEFIRLLDEIGFSHPPTTIVRWRDDLLRASEFPCFVKTAHGTAGLGVHEVVSREILERIANQLENVGYLNGNGEVLIQRPATGELSVAFAIFQRGRLVAHHMTRVRRYGVGNMARESVEHAGVADDLSQIGAYLNWHGALFMDYFFDEATGNRQYIEANPRLGELINARLCGANLCEQMIRVSLGEDVQPLPIGKAGVRSHQGYLLGLATAMNGRSRAQVFGEVLRACCQHGDYKNSVDELVRPKEDIGSVLPAGVVLAQLAITPRCAQRIVHRAVEDYGLPGPAARAIAELPAERLAACFEM